LKAFVRRLTAVGSIAMSRLLPGAVKGENATGAVPDFIDQISQFRYFVLAN